MEIVQKEASKQKSRSRASVDWRSVGASLALTAAHGVVAGLVGVAVQKAAAPRKPKLGLIDGEEATVPLRTKLN